MITFPGLRERCVKIGSAGKTFSLTGWKVGYITAAPGLLQPIAKAHQFLTYTTPPNLQRAVAYGLGKDESYFSGLTKLMADRRDLLADGLRRLGLTPLRCGGTYFINVDIGGLDVGSPARGDDGTDGPADAAFCQWLVREVGVAAIPVSAFYDRDPPTSVIRLCFCKKVETLEAALDRLAARFG